MISHVSLPCTVSLGINTAVGELRATGKPESGGPVGSGGGASVQIISGWGGLLASALRPAGFPGWLSRGTPEALCARSVQPPQQDSLGPLFVGDLSFQVNNPFTPWALPDWQGYKYSRLLSAARVGRDAFSVERC